jgi:hypothetical protein
MTPSTSAPPTGSSSTNSSGRSDSQKMEALWKIVIDWRNGHLSSKDAWGGTKALVKLNDE